IVMGTVDYMAPEQIKASMIDGRADQFSLAAVAYRMLTGSTLFGRHTLATLAYKLVNEAPPRVCERNTAIPSAVDEILGKALAKNPTDRYNTCGAFAEDLGRALTGEMTSLAAGATPTSTMTVRTPVAAAPGPAKRSKAGALIAAGVLIAGGAGAVAVWKPWSKPVPLQITAANSPEKPVETPPARVETPAIKTV